MIRRHALWLLVLPGIPILFAWDRFIVPAGTKTSDIMISHFPNLLFIQRSILSGEGVPLWSPTILSGYPFAANPLSTLWYPPAWPALLFPLPLGINLVMALHILIGSIGVYFFLQHKGISKGSALLAGIFYGFLPAGYSHVVAGHFTWVCASAWLPLLLAVSTDRNLHYLRRSAFQAFSLGFMMLADLRFSVYGIAIWFAYLLFQTIFLSGGIEKRERTGQILSAIGSGICATWISAVVWLPLLEYTRLSTRSLMTPADSFYLSLPPVQLTGLFVPGHPSTMEWILYPGCVIFLLALISLTFLRKKRELQFWLLAATVCLLWALGDVIPINDHVITLPVLNLLRVPSRGVYFLSFALLLISIFTIDELKRSNPQKAVFLRLGTIGSVVLVLLIQGFVVLANPDKNLHILWHMICWAAAAFFILLYSYRRITAEIFLISMGIIGLVDIGLIDINLLDMRVSTDAVSDGSKFVEVLKEKGGNFRVFSPSYSIPQHTAAVNSLELADGIDPLQLKSYSDFIRGSIGATADGYSVTLPAYKNGKPDSDNIGIDPSADRLALLNVKYLVSEFSVNAEGWLREEIKGEGYLYRNDKAQGWAWVESGLETGDRNYSSVNQIIRRKNQILVNVQGPGVLHLAEVTYPGWQVTVDGEPAELLEAYNLIRAVELEPGSHSVIFDFQPVKIYTGGLISLTTFFLGVILINLKRFHV